MRCGDRPLSASKPWCRQLARLSEIRSVKILTGVHPEDSREFSKTYRWCTVAVPLLKLLPGTMSNSEKPEHNPPLRNGLDRNWTAIECTFVTVGAIVLIEGLRVFGAILFPYPGLLLLLGIAWAAHRAGFKNTILSQIAAVFYEGLYFSASGGPFHYSTENCIRVVIFALVTPAVAMAVVTVKSKTVQAALSAARLQHRRELLCEKARMESIVQSLPLGLLMVDARGSVMMSNPQMTSILRHSPAEFLCPSRERLFSESLQSFLPSDLPVARALAGRPVINEEILYLRGDDTMVSLRMSATAVRGSAHEILGAAVMLEDITGQKLGRQAAQEMAALVNASTDAIYRVSTDGLILSWNPGAQRLLGYTTEEARYMSVGALLPTSLEDTFQRLLRVIRTGKQAYGFSTVLVSKDGARVPVSMSITPVFGTDESKVMGASLVAQALEQEGCFGRTANCAA